jgi:hypothetical protein
MELQCMYSIHNHCHVSKGQKDTHENVSEMWSSHLFIDSLHVASRNAFVNMYILVKCYFSNLQVYIVSLKLA